MKAIEVKVRTSRNNYDYIENLLNAVIFLRHPEDKIVAKNGESVIVDIYENGNLIFSGEKYEFFEKLKS